MLGVLITLLFSLGCAGVGLAIIGRWLKDSDPALRFGASGIAGLGAIGMLILPIGLLPGGLKWGLAIPILVGLAGFAVLFKQSAFPKFAKPEGTTPLFVVPLVAAVLFGLIGCLAPSDSLDWDSLAYHLAVPKLWLGAGQIQFVSFIHHSNFPFTVDNLNVLGLTWGGQYGAKAFQLAFFIYGILAIFGLARERYGEKAGWWAALAFAGMPVVIWESGTAYIDVANGLFAGLGILFACEFVADPEKRDRAWLGAVFLGLAAGSKYTGLQNIAAVGLVAAVIGARRGVRIRSVALIVGVAVAIGSPWYLKNVVNTGNPVYPFFYSVFHGKNWDAFSDKIYKEQQQTFGAGRAMPSAEQPNYNLNSLDPSRLGSSILGLAYQPGRYTDPGPTQGNGFPTQALGFVGIASLMMWLLSGKLETFERSAIWTVLFSFLMWFALSQQARYIIGLMVPLTVLAGGGVVKLPMGKVFSGLIGLQAALALAVVYKQTVTPKLPVVLGKVSADEYSDAGIGFSKPAKYLNENVKGGKVALYDEVFGFLLDVPYFWAGPGHSTEIGYDHLETGADLVGSLKKLGITDVYLNLSIYPQDANFQAWIGAMGLTGPPVPFTPEKKAEWSSDIRNKWKVLMADAIANHLLGVSQTFGRRIVLHVQ